MTLIMASAGAVVSRRTLPADQLPEVSANLCAAFRLEVQEIPYARRWRSRALAPRNSRSAGPWYLGVSIRSARQSAP